MKRTLAIIIIIVVALFWLINRPSQEVISIPEEEYLIIGDMAFMENRPVVLEDNHIYISFNAIKEGLDPYIFYDGNEKILIITNEEQVIRFKIDEKLATINHREFYIDNTIKIIDGQVYIPDEILKNYYSVGINYFEDTKSIVLDKDNFNPTKGDIIVEGGHLRLSPNKKSPIVLKSLPLETKFIVFEDYENWYKIRTENGILGYMEKKYIKLDYKEDNTKASSEKTWDNREKINLTWDYTHGKMSEIGEINDIEGINILSPTWFSIMDVEGNIFDKGNPKYVKEYQALGYEIWPLIDNSFDPDLTHDLLSSSNTRENLIRHISSIYREYNANGINIDFENIYIKDKELLTQFIRELYPVFKEMNMIVSMDISPVSTSENWSLSYDRQELSKTVDYLMLMAYDQHWSTSPVAGSVAEYSWVEDSIVGVLEEIPREKLILGIPFYTRLWKIERDANGEQISSQALSMESAQEFIEENNIELEWDENSGQYYGEIEIENIVYKIWLENKDSIKLKSTLVNKYNLAGIASWRKGFETEDIWQVLSSIVKYN